MKALALVLALTMLPFQGTIDFKPKVGQKLTYASSTSFEIAGNAAKLDATIEMNVKKSDEKSTEVEGKWSDLKVVVADNELPVEVTDTKVELTPAGYPTKVRGGIEGSDAVQLLLLTFFIPPSQKELTPGMKYTVDVPETKDEVGAFKYEGEYVGKENLDGKEVHKFKANLKMTGDAGLQSKQTIWVRPDGAIVKAESEFKNMAVPAAGSTADGKATLTLKS